MSANSPSTYKFTVHPTILRYALPLSKFLRLPSNTGKEVRVGLIIVRKGYQGEFEKVFRGEEDDITTSRTDELDNKDTRAIKPKALLIRPIPESLSAQIHPDYQEGWDLPSIPAVLGTDQTLLETVARCAMEKTGKELKEISRFLGSWEYGYAPADQAGEVDVVKPDEGVRRVLEGRMSGTAGRRIIRRFDFAVKLYPGPVILPEGGRGDGWIRKRVGG